MGDQFGDLHGPTHGYDCNIATICIESHVNKHSLTFAHWHSKCNSQVSFMLSDISNTLHDEEFAQVLCCCDVHELPYTSALDPYM
jgi:hypothetical protein